MPVNLIFETHSISEDNEAGIATGWLPGRLSERGRQAAAELGERRRGDALAVVFTSDLPRAIETAEIAFAGTGIPVIHDPRLRECNYGDLNGAPVAQVQAERARYVDQPFPGGESYSQVVDRVASFLADVAREHDGERVLVVSHSAPRWALDHLLGGVPLPSLLAAPFEWRPGWSYTLPSGWAREWHKSRNTGV